MEGLDFDFDFDFDFGGRVGFTLVELLLVVVIVGLLAGVAVPGYQKVMDRTRAARVISDLQAIRTAALQYETAVGSWPVDQNTGVVPPELEPYIESIEFTGRGYVLDWDNWETMIGVAVIVEEAGLEAALLNLLGSTGSVFVRLEDRYTYVIATP